MAVTSDHKEESSNGETTATPLVEQRRFSVSDVVLSAIKPGINHSLLQFINGVFLVLILTIVLIICFLTGYKLYMIILLVLAFGLFIGLNK
jgi:hypothetical protein